MSKKILALAPHPDDIEFGCGATISKLASQGHDIWYFAFSPCNRSMPEGFEENQLYRELEKSASILGIDGSKVNTFDFEVREFPGVRQEILEILIEQRNSLKPDLVLLPSSFDIHQDHKVVSDEGVRAFKNSSILGYELPWNTPKFHHGYFSKVTQDQLEKKISSIHCYQTQKGKNYSDPEFIKGLARLRGVQAGAELAEGFELIRWIE